MRGRRFTILAAISFVLCLATVGLWVRSYWRWDYVRYQGLTPQWLGSRRGISSVTGILILHNINCQFTENPRSNWGPTGWRIECKPAWGWRRLVPLESEDGVWFCGFGFGQHVDNPASLGTTSWYVEDSHDIFFPHWFVCGLFALAPARWVFVHRRGRLRKRRGQCRNCGYDLRATPDAGGSLLERCPECGNEGEG